MAVEDGVQSVRVFQDALDAGNPFRLVLLDIQMPHMDGQEALVQIRQMEKLSLGLAAFPLRVEGVEFHLQPFLGRFVDAAAFGAPHGIGAQHLRRHLRRGSNVPVNVETSVGQRILATITTREQITLAQLHTDLKVPKPTRHRHLEKLQVEGRVRRIGTVPSQSPFVRCDGAIFRYAYDPALVGKTIFMKFPAFNQFGGGGQSMADAGEYSFRVVGN